VTRSVRSQAAFSLGVILHASSFRREPAGTRAEGLVITCDAMKPTSHVASETARPLASIPILLILAVAAHAVIVGCGGRQESGSTSGTDQTPTSQPAPDTGGAVPGDQLALGAKVYTERCVLCHGPQGKGDGPGSVGLNPKPRNHTDGSYMNARTDEDLLAVIRDGKGAMPAWKAVLSEQEIQAVLKHVRSLAR
jgi:mono/diheme cytochrome c family protein